MKKKIEDMDVYRTAISLGTRLYGLKTSHDSAVHAKVRETSLSMVLNLASGLGFWEKQWKLSHLKATKQALLELPPLLELMVALGELKPEMEHIFGVQIKELTERVQRLIRTAGKMKEVAE